MGLIATCGLALLGIVGAACARQIADEFKEWTPCVTDRLMRAAVRRLPEGQQQRYEEEWRAHLCDVPGQVAKLYVAFGFLRASWAIARYHASKLGRLPKASSEANYIMASEYRMTVRDDGRLLARGNITWKDCDATVTCGSCGVMIEEHAVNPVWRGEPCPDCGSRDRIYDRISDENPAGPAGGFLGKIARRAAEFLRLPP